MFFNPLISFICEEDQEKIVRTFNGEYTAISVDDILVLYILLNNKTFFSRLGKVEKGGDKHD
jgi:hypothetical protein